MTHLCVNLHYAIDNNHDDCIFRLLENGSKFCGTPIIQYATSWNLHDKIPILIERGADVNENDHNGGTALHYAASNHRHQCIITLLQQGAKKCNINSKDQYGMTPLHRASLAGFIEGVLTLLDHGADYTERDNEGKTPPDLANIRYPYIFDEWIANNEILIKEPDEN